MARTKPAHTTTRLYDVAEHLRTREEMALYLSACIEESDCDASFVAKALGDTRALGVQLLAKPAKPPTTESLE